MGLGRSTEPTQIVGWGSTAHLFVGTLACLGKWRGILAPDMTQPRVVDGLDRICRGLGGISRVWGFDRMATVCHPDTGRVTASFAGVAKYYGTSVAICPPRRGNRKGAVERSNHTAAQRWWRTLPDDLTIEQARARLDRFCSLRGDTRLRPTKDGKASVATIATTEGLHPLPVTAYPAILTTERVVSRQALVSYRGNRYSVPPELASAQVTVSQVLGTDVIDIVTASNIAIARHRLAADGPGRWSAITDTSTPSNKLRWPVRTLAARTAEKNASHPARTLSLPRTDSELPLTQYLPLKRLTTRTLVTQRN